MNAGQSLSDAVGSKAEVAGNLGSRLISLVESLLPSTLFSPAEARPMSPGQPLTDALGNSGTVAHGNGRSALLGIVATVGTLALIGELVRSNTTPPPTQDQVREQIAAHDANVRASIQEEDARKAQIAAQDEQRRLAIAKKPGA